jgi:hypothetical protein
MKLTQELTAATMYFHPVPKTPFFGFGKPKAKVN